MQKIIIYLVSFFIYSVLHAQTITGTIKDANTQMPISYASIQIHQDQGTVSNEEGKFEINISTVKPTDSLKISFLGYQTKTFGITEVPETIFLEEDVIDLEAVNLDQKQLSIAEIIQKITDNYAKNYQGIEHSKQRIFIRNQSIVKVKKFKMEINHAKNYEKKNIRKINSLIDSIRKPMLANTSLEYRDVLFDLYNKSKDSAKVSFIKATNLSNPNQNYTLEGVNDKLKEGFKQLFKDKIFKIKILFFKVEDSLKTDEIVKKEKQLAVYPFVMAKQMKQLYKHTIYPNNALLSEILNPKYYEYKITNNLFYNNEFVYEITYTPKKSKAKYQGKMYVSDETFAIIKLDFNMLPNKKLEGTNLKLLGVSYKIYDWNGSLEYYQNENDVYVPKYFKQSKKMYNYASVPLKFIENTPNKNKLKFKLKSTFETLMQQKSEILFLKNTPLSETAYEQVKIKKEFPLEKIKKYNPEIWKKYNIIAPSQQLLEYQIVE